MTTLYVPIGISASGKSIVANSLDAKVVSSDEIRGELGLRPGTPVWNRMTTRTIDLLSQGHSVTYDATNLKRTRRTDLIAKARRRIPGQKVIALLVLATERDMLERNGRRKDPEHVPEEVMSQQLRAFRLPMPAEGYDRIEVVRTSDRTEVPDERTLTEFDQENPHHTMTLGAHMRAVEKRTRHLCADAEMDETEAEELAMAAAWHDVGKLRTKTFKSTSGRVSRIAHYYGHENVGAHMLMSEILPALMPDTEDEAMLRIATLVEWHMRPYVWTSGTERALRRDMRFLDAHMMRKLQILHEADVSSH